MNNEVHFMSKSNEWYTPPIILTKVLLVLERIDLDPCSNSKKVPNVPASTHFTKSDDGLVLPWWGKVYMNPPYGREISKWIEKLCAEYESGHISEAIALVPSRTDTKWFRKLKEHPRCFVWGRLKFSGQDNSAPFPSMVVYLGNNVQKFTEVFSSIGDIYQRILPCS